LALCSLNRSLEDEEDNWQFINTLDRMRNRTDDNGLLCGTNCTYYAYCLMANHFHLLIREREERVVGLERLQQVPRQLPNNQMKTCQITKLLLISLCVS